MVLTGYQNTTFSVVILTTFWPHPTTSDLQQESGTDHELSIDDDDQVVLPGVSGITDSQSLYQVTPQQPN